MVDLSIIIPMYNAASTIKNTLESILAQTVEVKEIIVVNDGSSDNSVEVVKSIDDEHIILLSQENRGTSVAKNNGIQCASGKYVMFIDSDDVIEKNYIETHFAWVDKCDLVCSGMKVIYPLREMEVNINSISDTVNRVVDIKNLLYLLEDGELINVDVAKVFRRKILIDNNILFDERLHAGEDLKFNCEYFKYVKDGILLSYCGYHYIRLENGSLVSLYKPEMKLIVDEEIQTRKKLYNHFELFNDDYFIKRFNYTMMNAYITMVPNYYRNDCSLSRKQKVEVLSEIKKEIQRIPNTGQVNKQDNVMYSVLTKCSPSVANVIFTCLFALKERFHFVYRKLF